MHFKGPDLVEYHVPLLTEGSKPSVPGDTFEHFYLIPSQQPKHTARFTDLIRAQPSRDEHQCLQRPWAQFLSKLWCPGISPKVVPSESIARQHSCCLFPTRLVWWKHITLCDKTSVIEVLVLCSSTVAGGDAGVLSRRQSGAGGLQVRHEDGPQRDEGAGQAQADPSDPRTGEKHEPWAGLCSKAQQCLRAFVWFV